LRCGELSKLFPPLTQTPEERETEGRAGTGYRE
jgi:hypothetical protein